MVTMIIIINHRYANHSLYLSNGLARMVSFRSLPDYGPHGGIQRYANNLFYLSMAYMVALRTLLIIYFT